MLSGCTIVHTLVPFRIQEVEELCDTDFEFHFDFKVLPDIHPLNELPQDHLLSLDTAPRIQVGPGHNLVILLLDGNGKVFQISRLTCRQYGAMCTSMCCFFSECVLYYDESSLFCFFMCYMYHCMMIFFGTANQKYAKKVSSDFYKIDMIP